MKLKELAIQSGLPTALDYHQKRYEKFAQLIIKECLAQVHDEVQYEHDWKLADAVSKRVLKHFGVEE